jgi:hypothetical protein
MRKVLVVLGFALALAAPAAAQGTHAPSHLAAARQLMEAAEVQKAAMAGVEVMIAEQVRTNPAMSRYRQTMLEWARAIFTGEDAVNAFAALYADAYTEDELRQLVAFYRTPLGQKMAANQTVLATRGAELGRQLAERKQGDLLARIQQVDAKGKP